MSTTCCCIYMDKGNIRSTSTMLQSQDELEKKKIEEKIFIRIADILCREHLVTLEERMCLEKKIYRRERTLSEGEKNPE